MKALWTFIRRRWWLTQDRLVSTMIIVFLAPIVIYLFIHLPFKSIIIRSVGNIPYASWALPGYLMILSLIGLIPMIYRDLFELRIHHKAIIPISLAPVTKIDIIVGVLVTAVFESMIYVLFGLVVFCSLIPLTFNLYEYILIGLYLLLQGFLIGNLLITIALLTQRVTTYLPMIILVIFGIIFSSGYLFEFEFFPTGISQALRYNPTGLLLQNLRSLLFVGYLNYWTLAVPILLSAVWIYLNSIILRKRLKQ